MPPHFTKGVPSCPTELGMCAVDVISSLLAKFLTQSVSLEHILFLQGHRLQRLTTLPAKSTGINLGMTKALLNGHTLETMEKSKEKQKGHK